MTFAIGYTYNNIYVIYSQYISTYISDLSNNSTTPDNFYPHFQNQKICTYNAKTI